MWRSLVDHIGKYTICTFWIHDIQNPPTDQHLINLLFFETKIKIPIRKYVSCFSRTTSKLAMTSFATKWGKLDHLEIKLATIGGFLTLANDALERSKCANATVTYFLKKQKKKQKKKTLLIRGKTEFVSRMRDQIQSQDACAHTEANQRKIANHTTYDTEIFDEFRKELANFIR